LDDILYALIRREQTKRQHNVFSFRSEAILVEIGIGKGQIRDAVRN
jgi:tRNA G46 methylase TrmB